VKFIMAAIFFKMAAIPSNHKCLYYKLVVHDQTKRYLVRNYTYLFYVYNLFMSFA
jgi:hypothetical protein